MDHTVGPGDPEGMEGVLTQRGRHEPEGLGSEDIVERGNIVRHHLKREQFFVQTDAERLSTQISRLHEGGVHGFPRRMAGADGEIPDR